MQWTECSTIAKSGSVWQCLPTWVQTWLWIALIRRLFVVFRVVWWMSWLFNSNNELMTLFKVYSSVSDSVRNRSLRPLKAIHSTTHWHLDKTLISHFQTTYQSIVSLPRNSFVTHHLWGLVWAMAVGFVAFGVHLWSNVLAERVSPVADGWHRSLSSHVFVLILGANYRIYWLRSSLISVPIARHLRDRCHHLCLQLISCLL